MDLKIFFLVVFLCLMSLDLVSAQVKILFPIDTALCLQYWQGCSVDSDCPFLNSGPGKCVGRRNLNCGAKKFARPGANCQFRTRRCARCVTNATATEEDADKISVFNIVIS